MKIFNEKTVVNFAFPKAPEKEGYLLKKRSEAKRSFNRRYFVLHGNILVYSESKFGKEPLGVIFLEGHSVELVDERMFAIHFHTSAYTGRSYILQAESEAEAESWMQALAHCGSEFLTLSVEELEDAFRALNSLADCPGGGSGGSPAQRAPVNTAHSSAAAAGHRNPFNAPITSSRDHRQGCQKQQQQHSIDHLTGLMMLSWEKMQANVREYLDGAAVPAEATAQQHL
ncbi:Sesquipedalian-1 [Echinococcus granulosus]|nr:Sesquipedalian-1 [Echinococcus granulosus]CDS20775.1 Pleckstrin y [Echinococcus granulosus]